MIPKSKISVNKLKYNLTEKNRFSMAIDENNAYRITERLAFPRLVGSEGEKKAIEIILEEFKKMNYNPIHSDKFKTSFYNWLLIRYGFLPIGFALVILAIAFYVNPFLTIGLSIFNFFMATRALKLTTLHRIKLCKNEKYNFETQNIFTNLRSKKAHAKVVFMGHWDSKSQTIPPSIRMLTFLISILGSFILYLLYVILSFVQIFYHFNLPVLNVILLIISIIISLIGALNYFNVTGNKSPGAFDNAAAVGSIIELARYFKQNPVNNIDLIFLCTGSEELNLGGAVHFIQTHKNDFNNKSTFFINLDFIGGSEFIRLISSYGIPKKISSEKLNKLFFSSAKELNISIKDIYAPTGVWSDYMPIVQEGFEACWVASQPGMKFVHTIKDNMNLISKKGLKNVLLLCVNVVKKLNDEFN